MKSNKFFRKILIFVLIFTISPLSLFEKEIQAQSSGIEQSNQINITDEDQEATLEKDVKPYKKGVKVLKELQGKRTRNSKSYLNSDNTITLASSYNSLNYIEGGVWKEIDTTIKTDNSDTNFSNSVNSNNFKVRFNRKSNKPIKFEVNQNNVKYTAKNTNNVDGIISDNVIRFPNAWKDTELQYTVQNDALKMELHLADSDAPKTFEFDIKEKGVNYRLNDDGTIDFIDKDEKISFRIPKMWVKDTSSDELRYDRLQTNVMQKGNTVTLKFTLNDIGLVYPLIIDPTTVAGFYSAISDSVSWTNKIYMDSPNVDVAAITNVRFENQGGYGAAYGRASDVYLTRAEYGNLYGFGVNSSAPGSDGKNAVWVGKTNFINTASRAYIDIPGATIRSYFGNTGTVYGGAVWGGANMYVDMGWIYITYSDTTAPTTPTNLILTNQTGTNVSLSWAGSTDYYGVVGYDIYNGANFLATTASTSYIITGLTEATIYNLSVKARDGAGNNSTSSNTLLITIPDLTAPTVPTNLISTSKTETSVNLSWSAATDNVGVTSYDVYKGGTFLISTTSPSYVVSGLVGGTNYNFQVRARDAAGNFSSLCSVLSIVTSDLTAPTIPTNLISPSNTGISLNLSWTASTDNVAIAGYDIYKGSSLVESIGTSTAYTVQGLNPNNYYEFSVKARDTTGNTSPLSNVLSVLTLATVPTFSLVKTSSNSIDLNIVDTNPSNTQYQIFNGQKYVTLSGELSSYEQWFTLPDKKLTISGLIPGISYLFTAKARNSNGDISASSSFSNDSIPTMTDYTSPSGIVSASSELGSPKTKAWNAFDDSGDIVDTGGWHAALGLTIGWLAYEFPTAKVIQQYTIKQQPYGGGNTRAPKNWTFEGWTGTAWDTLDTQTNIGAWQLGVKKYFNLNNKKAYIKYRINVTANNGDPYLVIGEMEMFLADMTLPSIPSNVNAKLSDHQAIVIWDPVKASDGYDIEVDGTVIDSGGNLFYSHTSLVANSTHGYRVRAKKDGVTSPWSALVKVTIPESLPIPPSNIVIASSATSVSITWNTVTSALSYELELDGQIKNVGATLSYKLKGLSPGTQHTYRIRSINGTGVGNWSILQKLTTPLTVPAITSKVVADATNESITLAWDQNPDAQGYEVEADGSIVYSGADTSMTQSGLASGSSHVYRVRANNSVGTSTSWSTSVTAATYLLAAPSHFSAVEFATSITLTWDNTLDATGYDVELDGVIKDLGNTASFASINLQPETLHQYRIRAKNTSGLSSWSPPLKVSTLPIQPGIPISITATISKEVITLSWSQVPHPSGTGWSDGYDVEIDGEVVIDNYNSTNYADIDLKAFSQHTYRVRAKTNAIVGDWSPLFTAKTLPGVPIVPQHITLSSVGNLVTVSWDADNSTKGYDIEVDGTIIDMGTDTSYVHRRIAAGTQHVYRIRSRNILGNSEWSGKIKNNTISARMKKGKTVDLGLTAQDIVDFSQYTLVVVYDPKAMSVVDLSALTNKLELQTGKIEGTDITITEFTPGKITFTTNKAITLGESWTGIINSIRFKASVSGGSAITYTVFSKVGVTP